ncbi:LytR/AlgR family response regulator transcription factor [Guggenheimella bovis]
MKTLRIALCEDEQIQRDQLISLLKSLQADLKATIEIQTFSSAEALLFHFEENEFDLLLLDVMLGGINGFEAAEKIRLTSKVPIAFITAVAEQIARGYDYRAIHYIIKPATKDQLKRVLETVLNEVPETYVCFQTFEGELRLREDEVYGFFYEDQELLLILRDKKVHLRERLHEQLLKGSNKFFQTHRNAICHIDHVYFIGKDRVDLENGTSLPLSRRSQKGILEAFLKANRANS